MMDLSSSDCIVSGVATLGCLPIILQNIIFWLIAVAGIAALFFVILGGFKFLTSGGDPKQVDSARKTLTYALIGLGIIIFAGLIFSLIASITGTDCIKSFSLGNCQPK